MRRHGIQAPVPAAVPGHDDSNHAFPLVPNLLARRFTAPAPNRVWLADITYVPTEGGWLYLAVVLDLFARKVVGWAMAPTMAQELTLAALRHGDHQPATATRLALTDASAVSPYSSQLFPSDVLR